MSSVSADIRKRDRMIEELRGFIKKVLIDPSIATQSLDIARALMNETNAERKIADRISATTSIKIPADLSDADKMYLDLLKEVLRDEKALY
ncbi:hypothetical protein WH50_25080 [Pokkaliibacter plantistimulans]|uniref:Uncharacterized protein n=1 Tax=Pokkaliibacter plantistimulans TaxID=1635171 RepID=A0ABX5LQ21_9GAMM|nr:hypothetical protein [Pokkaliibacter plantistimulans]PXF28677.1 hypothetical protein WH50_25080 [Pokkaliibacter plantistimulans]